VFLFADRSFTGYSSSPKTSTKITNVIFVPIGYSESTAVLPAGRNRITQKESCKVIGLTNPWPNFGQIFPERAKKGLNSSTILSLLIFPVVIALIN
jgi:hypothetical protein